MSTELTQATIDRYFDLMGRGADFAECFTADVTWLIADTGEVIHGPAPVLDYINALHATMTDMQGRKSVVGENYVYLEGDCVATDPDLRARDHYCIAYDMEGDLIAAMRCYVLGTRTPA